MNKKLLIVMLVLVLAGVGALIFYFYPKKTVVINPPQSNNDSFIEATMQSPAVEGNIVNSGIAGKIVMTNGQPFESSFEIFKKSDLSKPITSIRSHSDGTFQVPLKSGVYVLKPLDPDGPIAPTRASYDFMIGSGQWLQVKIEYKQQ